MFNIRIADAILFAAGASRIELGEKDRLLTDPYFPNHQPVDPVLRDILRCYYDFVVRYGDWIGPTTTKVTRFQIEVPDDVWVIVRKCSGWFVINLINMSGYDEPCWDRPLSQPDQIENLLIKIVDLNSAQQAWWASPDRGDLRLFPLDYWVEGNSINLELPSLDYWSMVAVKIGE